MIEEFVNNRYWKRVLGSGHKCDICGNWSNYLGTVKRKSDGLRVCLECYFARRYKKSKKVQS